MSFSPFCISASGSTIRGINASGVINSFSLNSVDSVYVANSGIHQAGGIVSDNAGNLYVGDLAKYVVYKIDPSYTVTRIAGTGTRGFSGDGGVATSAKIGVPGHLKLDALGNLYLTDPTNSVVRVVNMLSTTQTLLNVSVSPGCINTVAGTPGSAGISTGYLGDGGAATSATIDAFEDICLDVSGNLYLNETYNYTVRKVDHSTGIITTVAGNAVEGFSGDGGAAISAKLEQNCGCACDSNGNLYIVDSLNSRVRVVNVQGVTKTLFGVSVAAGNIQTIAGSSSRGFAGDGGLATSAELNYPFFATFDGSGNLYISDNSNYRIRYVDATTNFISTIAGDGSSSISGDGGNALSAGIGTPASSVAFFTGGVGAVLAETQLDSISSGGPSEFVRFRLRNFAGSVPQTFGSTITVTATLATGSTISQPLWPNSAITPSGTWYTAEMWSNGRITSSANYDFTTSIDLSSATPL